MVHYRPPGPVLISKRLVVIRSTNIKNVNYWLYGRASGRYARLLQGFRNRLSQAYF